MTIIDFEPISTASLLREEPPGVFRVGKSRVLLELVLQGYLAGNNPEAIVQSYPALQLADVYAVIARYLANPTPFDAYLRECDVNAEAIRHQLEAAGRTGSVGKEELLARARAKRLVP